MQRDHNTRNELTNSKVLQFCSQPDDEAQRLTKRLANLYNSKARPAYPRHQSTRMTYANTYQQLGIKLIC
jgi:hypothetical protein